MHTPCCSDSGGEGRGLPTETPPGQRPPDKGTLAQRPLRRNMGLETETLLEGTWDQAARQEVTYYRNPPCERMTDRQV